jgi:hypothetical protein
MSHGVIKKSDISNFNIRDKIRHVSLILSMCPFFFFKGKIILVLLKKDHERKRFYIIEQKDMRKS